MPGFSDNDDKHERINDIIIAGINEYHSHDDDVDTVAALNDILEHIDYAGHLVDLRNNFVDAFAIYYTDDFTHADVATAAAALAAALANPPRNRQQR